MAIRNISQVGQGGDNMLPILMMIMEMRRQEAGEKSKERLGMAQLSAQQGAAERDFKLKVFSDAYKIEDLKERAEYLRRFGYDIGGDAGAGADEAATVTEPDFGLLEKGAGGAGKVGEKIIGRRGQELVTEALLPGARRLAYEGQAETGPTAVGIKQLETSIASALQAGKGRDEIISFIKKNKKKIGFQLENQEIENLVNITANRMPAGDVVVPELGPLPQEVETELGSYTQ